MELFPVDHLDKETPKIYYSIGEVSNMFKVNTSLIRFWEREFEILRPKKNAKGNRLFTLEDVDNLKIIFHLVKERGFTLDGAKKRMRDNKNDIEHTVRVTESLRKIRSFMEELRDQL
ncbi:MAG: MerR family transcriptional regulator [Bacteroidota bacterium]